MALTSETRIGPYEIVSSLGAGGMGEVYRARDPRLGRDVAIKVLPASYSNDADRLRRFEQEARAAASLNHPNILAIYDIGASEGSPYIVSELLEGRTLRDRLRGGPLSQRKAVEHAMDVARGLAAAHDKGIVHRDLKPENIFITEDGRVKILDFGLAKLKHPENAAVGTGAVTLDTDAGTVLGTMGYMSPEQVRSRTVDHRSDIFALGAILYEMLSGKRAFHGETPADTLSAILNHDPPDLSETNRQVAPALERIVRHCLEKNPAERFQSMRDIAFDLESLSVSGSSKLKIEPSPPSRRPVLIAAFAMLVLSALLAGAFFVGRTTVKVQSPKFHRLTFRRGSVRAARFAPDGQTIVYGGAWEGKPVELFTTRFDSNDSRSLGLGHTQLLGISSTGELAIIASPRSNSGFVQEGNLARVPLAGGAPREVLDHVEWADWSPDTKGLAIVRGAGRLLNYLESPPGKLIYRPDGWISHVRYAPSGDLIGFADHIAGGDDGRAVIIDREGKVRARSSFYTTIQGLAWSANGRELWFTAAPAGAARSLYAMDMSGRERLVLRVPATLTLHDVASNGLVLLSKDDAQYSTVALPPGEKNERNLSWFDWSIMVDLSPDGKQMLIGESGEAVASNNGLFLRWTDGSAAVRLGDATRGTFSPDGQWVVADTNAEPPQLQLLPTGVGQPRPLMNDKIYHLRAAWYPDGKRILFTGSEPGRPPRLFVYDLATGASRPITPEGTSALVITDIGMSPDGKRLLVTTSGRYAVLALEGGDTAAVPIRGLLPEEEPIGWDPSGKYVLVRVRELPLKISRLDPDTGKREFWKQITPAEPAGVEDISILKFVANGAYAYSYYRILSELYVVDGLK